MKKPSKRILIAEDNQKLLEFIDDFLKSIDPTFEIDDVPNSAEAAKKAAEKDYDIILSDYDMPYMNGMELFLFLKQGKYNGKFYLMSGHVLDRKKIRKLKINGFLSKPFDSASFEKIFKKR